MCLGGQLRKFDPVTRKTTNEKFVFKVKSVFAGYGYNQKHYEALGEVN
jgi:hypothetical protein